MLNRLARFAGYRLAKATPDKDLAEFLGEMRPQPIRTPLIRVGADGDGGYLVPDLLDGISACFSPGVSDQCSFESDLARRGIRSFMVDYSVDGPPEANPLFSFERRFLGPFTDEVHIRLEDWVERSHDLAPGDLLLQMDIEGAEYPVILDTPRSIFERFRIVVIEFHEFDQVFVRSTFEHYRACFRKLLESFVVVHIHPNNGTRPRSNGRFEVPKTFEITFLRKDCVDPAPDGVLVFPHPLDAPNVPGKPDWVLPEAMR